MSYSVCLLSLFLCTKYFCREYTTPFGVFLRNLSLSVINDQFGVFTFIVTDLAISTTLFCAIDLALFFISLFQMSDYIDLFFFIFFPFSTGLAV